jgi:hypothetical protein
MSTKCISRPAAVFRVGGVRPTALPGASRFGGAPACGAGETWPEGKTGPLSFVCQLNLAEAPFAPQQLAGVELVSLFADLSVPEYSIESGVDWCVRTYSGTADLVPLAPPSIGLAGRPFEGTWALVEDEPTFFDPDFQAPGDVDELEFSRALSNITGTKVGGFPSCVGRELAVAATIPVAQPVFCLQIDSEPKAGFSWGGGGRAFLFRGTAPGYSNHWYLEEQAG